MIGEIRLEGMTFHAFHGVHEFERRNGNEFEVSLVVSTNIDLAANNDDLRGTIDYEELYKVVQTEMQVPARLLEHLAHRITHQLVTQFNQLEKVTVEIAKLNPQIGGPCRKSVVTLTTIVR